MKLKILRYTLESLPEVTSPRFYRSERGYAGALHNSINQRLINEGLMTAGRILELEAQKRHYAHGMTQRPDLIFHIPVEVSAANVDENNYAVWAFKLGADTLAIDLVFIHGKPA